LAKKEMNQDNFVAVLIAQSDSVLDIADLEALLYLHAARSSFFLNDDSAANFRISAQISSLPAITKLSSLDNTLQEFLIDRGFTNEETAVVSYKNYIWAKSVSDNINRYVEGKIVERSKSGFNLGMAIVQYTWNGHVPNLP
jgi:hypothetical protein